MDALRLFFRETHQLSQKDVDYLVQQFQEVVVKKGTVLFKEGTLVDAVYFVSEGVLHHYNYNEEGQKITLDLHEAPCFCTNLESFSDRKVSQESCVALTDCTLYVLKKEQYDCLIHSHVKWSNLAKDIIEKDLIKLLAQSKATANKSIEQRYLELVRKSPSIIQNASISVIASYLRTSRETLHRIRRKLVLS